MPQGNFHFSISERKLYLRFVDILISLLGLFLINYFFNFQYFNFYNENSVVWTILLAFYVLSFGEIFEMYNLKVASDTYLTLRSTFITVVFTTLFYVFTPILSPELPHYRIQIAYFALALFFSILVNRFLYIQLIFSPRFLKNILLIAEANQIENIVALNKSKTANKIVAYISNTALKNNKDLVFINNVNANIEQIVKENYINEIIVSSTNLKFTSQNINNQLIELFKKGVVIKSVDSFIEKETFRIYEAKLTSDFYNYFTFSKSHQNNLYLTFRRIFDVLFSVIGILLTLILVPIIFVGNLFGNKGGLFYTQKRVGEKGAEFSIIKFRTMVTNAEKNGVVWAVKNDSRITSFGKFLRKTRLDEFPQFYNVLKNEMSLIGPRPERLKFVQQLEKEIPFYAIRHVIKPGLTGWSQVMYPHASSVKDQHEKLMYDLYYIKERNLLLDFKIVVKTISAIIFFRGN